MEARMQSKKTAALIALTTLALSTAAEPPSHGEPAATGSKPTAVLKTTPPGPRTQNATAKTAAKAAAEDRTYTADEALSMLMEGNERWVSNRVDAPSTSPERREATTSGGQHPFATIITCADSRLPVERLFDRGVGELFVTRVAGNIAGPSETGTIEYGVGHLHTPLLVVMGHAKCGAVAAAAADAKVHGQVAGILAKVGPAVERAKRQNPSLKGDELVAAAVKENVWQTVFDLLKQSDGLRTQVQQGQLRIVGAVCDISTGRVEFMGEHPWQAELMTALNVPAGQATAVAPESHDDDAPGGH
ncbi:MAG: carbonic anhydrase [Leptolyngbya sp. PLA1]|nr:carbonic anhydrase [Leptolyngbya sp. PLA1]